MCLLRTISKSEMKGDRYWKPEMEGKWKVGYKIFRAKNGSLFSQIFNSKIEFPIQRWVHEKQFRRSQRQKWIQTNWNSDRYQIGFHIWCNRTGARNFSPERNMEIRKVKYRQEVAHGYQWSNKVVIAKEMLVTNEVIPKR